MYTLEEIINMDITVEINEGMITYLVPIDGDKSRREIIYEH